MSQENWLISSLSLLSKIILAFILPNIIFLTGCGYTLKGKGSFLPEYIESIYIPEFQNRTSKFELEKIISQKMQTEFLSRGSFSIANTEEEANASLTGTITDYTTSPKSVDASGRATSYSIKITVDVKFRDLKADKLLFEDNSYSITEEYQLNSSDENFLEQEEFAIEEATNKLAEALVGAILEGF
jgi:outer membrane lipopolysaccharide assembly protein LptE/RlpB